MEYIFPSSDRHYSPIWIEAVEPLKAGDGQLEIAFFHANYPEGVQEKRYTLYVLRREVGYLLLEDRSKDSIAAVLITEIDLDWLKRHFPQLCDTLLQPTDVQGWLEQFRRRSA